MKIIFLKNGKTIEPDKFVFWGNWIKVWDSGFIDFYPPNEISSIREIKDFKRKRF